MCLVLTVNVVDHVGHCTFSLSYFLMKATINRKHKNTKSLTYAVLRFTASSAKDYCNNSTARRPGVTVLYWYVNTL